jgi:hypothetical protein
MRRRLKSVPLPVLVTVTLCIVVSAAWTVPAYRAGSPPGYTGAPGEGTCADAGCHDSYALNSGAELTVYASYGGQDTITVDVVVKGDSTERYGFMVVARDTLAEPVGTFTPYDTLETQAGVDSAGHSYATHTRVGTAESPVIDRKSWRVLWTQSADTPQTVTLYGAAVIGNGDSLPAGDYVRTDSATIAFAPAQCAWACGDVDLNGGVTTSDLSQIAKFTKHALLYGDTACSDMDGREGLNVRDVIWLARTVFHSGPAPRCPPDSPAYVPQPSLDFVLTLNNVCPAGSSRVRVYPEFRATAPLGTISADLAMDIGGVTPVVDSIRGGAVPPDTFWSWQLINVPVTGTDGVVMISFLDWILRPAPPGEYALGWFDITVPPEPYPRYIDFELTGYPEGHNTPMVVDSNLVGWEIQLATYSIGQTGDVNADGVITSADVIWLVNYVFKDGPSPYPIPATGDVRCSGNVTSADIVYLVNYVFRSGPAPCDVEAECTVDLDAWTCP